MTLKRLLASLLIMFALGFLASRSRVFAQVQNIRCGSCKALLFRAAGDAISAAIEIKCRRCGVINSIRPLPAGRQEPEPERPSGTSPERQIEGPGRCGFISPKPFCKT